MMRRPACLLDQRPHGAAQDENTLLEQRFDLNLLPNLNSRLPIHPPLENLNRDHIVSLLHRKPGIGGLLDIDLDPPIPSPPIMIAALIRPYLAGSAVLTILLLVVLCWLCPSNLNAAPYFEDGFLGLTQAELHAKMGRPQAVRDRKSALRIFTYYPITDWSSYFSKLVSPENGEDVYTFTRNGTAVRYSFSYMANPNDASENRPLFVRLVDIELSPPRPIDTLPSLIPEFRPSTEQASPAFRSNIWVLLFKGAPSPEARFIIREQEKDRLDWLLSYQLFSMQGLPDRLTGSVLIDRIEIGAQSLQLVTQRQRHTHEPILNPYSSEFIRQSAIPASPAMTIPVPKYAE